MLSVVLVVLALTVLAADRLGVLYFLPSTLGYFVPALALTIFFVWRRLRTFKLEGVAWADQVVALSLFFVPVDDAVWTIGAALLGGLSVADRKTARLKPSSLYTTTMTLVLYSCLRAAVYFGVVQHMIDTGWRFFIEVTLAFIFGRFLNTRAIADQDSVPLLSSSDTVALVEPAG
jgi:hypothetical protein